MNLKNKRALVTGGSRGIIAYSTASAPASPWPG